jgi:hypothetical protein
MSSFIVKKNPALRSFCPKKFYSFLLLHAPRGMEVHFSLKSNLQHMQSPFIQLRTHSLTTKAPWTTAIVDVAPIPATGEGGQDQEEGHHHRHAHCTGGARPGGTAGVGGLRRWG